MDFWCRQTAGWNLSIGLLLWKSHVKVHIILRLFTFCAISRYAVTHRAWHNPRTYNFTTERLHPTQTELHHRVDLFVKIPGIRCEGGKKRKAGVGIWSCKGVSSLYNLSLLTVHPQWLWAGVGGGGGSVWRDGRTEGDVSGSVFYHCSSGRSSYALKGTDRYI